MFIAFISEKYGESCGGSGLAISGIVPRVDGGRGGGQTPEMELFECNDAILS
jgi:hypothetical protein